MNINEKISLFRAANDPHPVNEVSIHDFCVSVIGGEFASEIETIRNASDPEAKKNLKSKLPSFTISGTFHHRSASDLIKHSGFICLDFDGKENPLITDWTACRDTIGGIKEVAFCAISASGFGCFALVPIMYPRQHEAQFEALKRDFDSLGLIIDKACKDVSRLRFISSDTGAILNLNAESYKRVYQPKTNLIKMSKPFNKGCQTTGEDEIYRRVCLWLDKTECFVHGNRNRYIMELAGGLHRFGASKDYALSKCLEFQENGFTAKEIEAVVKSIYSKLEWTNKAVK